MTTTPDQTDASDLRTTLHELRNHLSTIMICARAQKKRVADPDHVEEMANLIEKNVREATALLNEFSSKQSDG